jgi:iron complex outermembrane receptor protein
MKGLGMQGELKGRMAGGRLERFRAKWNPVRVKKTRQVKNLEPRSDFIGTEMALGSKVVAALLMGTALGSIIVVVPTPAQAQTAQQRTFAIRPQPLPSALTVFGQQTGLQVSVDAAAARGLTSPGATGTMTPAVALHRLLDGTGLSYRFTGASTVVIGTPGAQAGGTNVAGAISLDTIDVQGETAWGPVQGFVASRSATATKTDTPLIEVPQSISVVTRDQMDTRKIDSLHDTLQYTAGVFAGSSGDQQFDPRFQIRGFVLEGWQGQIYLNGLPTFGFGDIEAYGLERVEVMRGPASVLYGQGEPAGTIGLVTKRPTENPVREVQVQGGSFGKKGIAFDLGGPVTEDKTLLYRLTGVMREGGNGIDFSKEERTFLSGSLTWRPTTATEITAYSFYQKDNGRWNFGLPAQGTVLPNPNGRIPITRYLGEPSVDYVNTEKTAVGYSLQHRATDSLTFRQNLQYARDKYDERDVSPAWNSSGVPGLESDSRTMNRIGLLTQYTFDTFAVDNQAELKFNTGPFQHTALFGVDYRWRQRNSQQAGWDTIVPPIDVYAPVYGLPVIWSTQWTTSRQTQNATGIYFQDQIKLDRWILTLGGRYDWADLRTVNIVSGSTTDKSDQAFTKRAGLGYEFDNGLVPYISYADSFLPIAGMYAPVAGSDLKPFKPTTGTQYEAGIKYQPKGATWRITGAVYDLRKQNVLTPDPVHPGYSIQTGEISSRGFELEAVASLSSNINLTAAYSYNDARVTKSTTGNLDKRPIGVPQHLASLWADYTIREGALNGLGFGGGVRYVGASAGNEMNTFYAPAYTLVDAMIRYDIDNWRFSLNVTNLFDKYYVAVCSDTCNPGRTRTVLGKVSYRW